MKVKFKRLHPNAVLPKRATDFSGGWDVVCTEIEKISNDFVICKLGFALGLPEGYKLTLVPRSSLTKTHWVLQNSPGLGDEDYLLEYQYRFRCIPSSSSVQSPYLNYQLFPYKVGDRIGQIYIEKVIPIEFEEVEELEDKQTRTGGYGSTGN